MIVKTKSVGKHRRQRPGPGHASLAGSAYDSIRDNILQGQFPIGAILSRRRLAEKLNMSFLPITEALQRLETDGLVESRPRIGTRVRIPSKEDIADSYVLREALETQAARLCAERMSKEERAQLIRSAKYLDELYAAGCAEKEDSQFLFSVHTYHLQFHMQVARCARSGGLVKAIEREQVLIFNWLYDTASQRTSLPSGFHSKLARALCSGDPQRADKAMRAHVRYGFRPILERFDSLQVPNSWRLKHNQSD